MSGQAGPGWYPDGAGGERWWDGQQWTDQSRPPQAPPGQPGQFGTPGQYGQPGRYGEYGQPGQAPKKKRGGLIALVAVLVVLVLVGGGVASYFAFFRDTDDDPRRDDETSAVGGPEDAAIAYTEAYATLDFRTMCELTSTDGRDDLYSDFDAADAADCDEFDDAASSAYDELLGDGESDVFGDYADIDELRADLSDNGRFVPGDVEVVEGDPEADDEVKVRVPGTYEYDGDNPDIDAENDDEIVLDMVREDDEWLVEGVDLTYDSDGGSSDDSTDGSSDSGGSSDEGVAEPSEQPTAATPDAAGAPAATEEAASALLQEIAVAAQGNDWETVCDNSSQGIQIYNFSFFDVEDCAGVAAAAGDRNWAEVEVRSVDVPEGAGEGDTATATLAHTSSAGAPGQQDVTLVVESGEWRLDTDLIPS
ncbi:DUF2510 domain-containing protein [Nocardioides zeae]|uniref:DUF2510 domain-containing protein n=1 Tax=Nocardioides zeae TaxID=1457234 RepID=UPI00188573A7|nr:DUF2510 domain-containing protein [Nocardioides zeae]